MSIRDSNTATAATTVSDQAVEWFARLRSPDVSREDVASFNTWWEASERHRQAFAEVDSLWLQVQDVAPEMIAHWRELKAQLLVKQTNLESGDGKNRVRRAKGIATVRRVKMGRMWPLRVAAAILITIGLVVSSFYIGSPDTQRHYTEIGEQKSIRLSDGSRVTLNTLTTLDVTFTKDRRQVTLVRGQAVFDVAKDEQRRFVVTVGSGTVTAYGTQFDIYKDKERNIVTLLEGSVLVEAQASRQAASLSKQQLRPGEQTSFMDGGDLERVKAVDVKKVSAWREGELHFDKTPLGLAVEENNRYTTLKLELSEPELSELVVSGRFRTGESEEIARAVEALFGLKSEHIGDKRIVIGKAQH